MLISAQQSRVVIIPIMAHCEICSATSIFKMDHFLPTYAECTLSALVLQNDSTIENWLLWYDPLLILRSWVGIETTNVRYVNCCHEPTAKFWVRVLQLSVVMMGLVRGGALEVCLAGTVNILVENVLVKQFLLSFLVITGTFHCG